MRKLGLATATTIAAGALGAVIVGLAGPAQAATTSPAPASIVSATTIATDLGHQTWASNNGGQSSPHVPHVDTTVHQSR